MTLYNMLVFVKGKNKPIALEKVVSYNIYSGCLAVEFEDGSQLILADGNWREADWMPAPAEVKSDPVKEQMNAADA